MRTETREVFTTDEMKAKHPAGFARIMERWEKDCDDSGDCPWGDEAMESMREVIKACGGTLGRYEIGPWSHSFVNVEVEDDDENGKRKGRDWLRLNVLKPNGYTDGRGRAAFPGVCHWTGYCADDDMIESVWKAVKSGETLTEALEGLADVVREHMEDACEQMRGEDSMLANWEDREWTAEGDPVES